MFAMHAHSPYLFCCRLVISGVGLMHSFISRVLGSNMTFPSLMFIFVLHLYVSSLSLLFIYVSYYVPIHNHMHNAFAHAIHNYWLSCAHLFMFKLTWHSIKFHVFFDLLVFSKLGIGSDRCRCVVRQQPFINFFIKHKLFRVIRCVLDFV